jgi:ribosomal protein S21
VQVLVRDNNVDQALKALKKKMQRGHFPEKPAAITKASEKKPAGRSRTRGWPQEAARACC